MKLGNARLTSSLSLLYWFISIISFVNSFSCCIVVFMQSRFTMNIVGVWIDVCMHIIICIALTYSLSSRRISYRSWLGSGVSYLVSTYRQLQSGHWLHSSYRKWHQRFSSWGARDFTHCHLIEGLPYYYNYVTAAITLCKFGVQLKVEYSVHFLWDHLAYTVSLAYLADSFFDSC